MKEFRGLGCIWTFNDVPEENEFVLITNGPFQDFAETAGRSKNKEELIKMGEKIKSKILSLLRIYNHKELIVWDAFLPTTFLPSEEQYDPEYFKEISEK
ncbi:MAG: hypothetical protein NT085_02520 [candidate division SR1 bacterium]|nr:hypothetical protein [candidate division SR1 bacterium]